MRYSDPTIPKKQNRKGNAGEKRWRPGPAIGRLHAIGDTITLVDHRGETWTQHEARLVFGAFGFGREGSQKSPRPWRYDTTGAVLEEGDEFVIDFIDGDHAQPFIRGGVQATIRDTPDGFFAGQPLGGNPNHLRMRLEQRNDAGAATRHLDVEVFGSDGQAELRVSGADPSGSKIRILFDGGASLVKLGTGSESSFVVTSGALADIGAILAAVATFVGGLGFVLPPHLVTALADLQTPPTEVNPGPYVSPSTRVD